MASSAPKRSWADRPMKLVTTPQFATKRTDLFTTGASHEALLHNSIIRGFNSIYVQAAHVQEPDKEDFVGYSSAWYHFIKAHLDDEKTEFFPKMEEVLTDKSIWTQTYEEHESFSIGLKQFNDYLTALPQPESFAPKELLRIMDSFRDQLEHHLHHQVDTIASLAHHTRAPAEATPEHKAAAQIFSNWAKRTVSKHGWTDIAPCFLLNLDRTFEDGLWAEWPPLPWFFRWGLVNLGGSWNGGYWIFASCDALGLPRELGTFSNR